jgi:hypothetical protein
MARQKVFIDCARRRPPPAKISKTRKMAAWDDDFPASLIAT